MCVSCCEPRTEVSGLSGEPRPEVSGLSLSPKTPPSAHTGADILGGATQSGSLDFTANLNPNSLQVLHPCYLEPGLASAAPGSRWQFERQGYFCVDPDSKPGKLVFNRTVGLKDSWAKAQKKQ